MDRLEKELVGEGESEGEDEFTTAESDKDEQSNSMQPQMIVSVINIIKLELILALFHLRLCVPIAKICHCIYFSKRWRQCIDT